MQIIVPLFLAIVTLSLKFGTANDVIDLPTSTENEVGQLGPVLGIVAVRHGLT